MTEDSRPVGDVRDTIVGAIDAGHLGTWEPPQMRPGYATVPTSRVIRAIASRLLGRTRRTADD